MAPRRRVPISEDASAGRRSRPTRRARSRPTSSPNPTPFPSTCRSSILRPFNTYGPRQSERAVISDRHPAGARPGLRRDPRRRPHAASATSILSPTRWRPSSPSAPRIASNTARAYNAGTGTARHHRRDDRRRARRHRHQQAGEPRISRASGPRTPRCAPCSPTRARSARRPPGRPRSILKSGIGTTVAWWRERFKRGAVRADAGYVL